MHYGLASSDSLDKLVSNTYHDAVETVNTLLGVFTAIMCTCKNVMFGEISIKRPVGAHDVIISSVLVHFWYWQ